MLNNQTETNLLAQKVLILDRSAFALQSGVKPTMKKKFIVHIYMQERKMGRAQKYAPDRGLEPLTLRLKV